MAVHEIIPIIEMDISNRLVAWAKCSETDFSRLLFQITYDYMHSEYIITSGAMTVTADYFERSGGMLPNMIHFYKKENRKIIASVSFPDLLVADVGSGLYIVKIPEKFMDELEIRLKAIQIGEIT